jgi:hypothetical protein
MTRHLQGQAVLALWLWAGLGGCGCAAINRQVDHWALQYKASMVLTRSVAFEPGAALPFYSAEELERLSRPPGPLAVAVAPLSRHRLGDTSLTQEELSFPSAIALRFPESNLARAYVYRQGELGARPVLLWVPGQHVAERDFPSLTEFFERSLAAGFDVVFYVPPYHLERTPAGFGSGDAFLASDFPDHLRAFAQELGDLRGLVAWLRARGVKELGAFGSSMGGTMVLRLVSWEPAFEFVTVMQPLVDWVALLRREEMAPVLARLRAQGVSDEDIVRVYQAVDPRNGRPQISAARISMLYGRYDQIALEGPLLSLKRLWGVRRLRVYERGHALITLGSRVFRDLSESLRVDRAALEFHRRFAR